MDLESSRLESQLMEMGIADLARIFWSHSDVTSISFDDRGLVRCLESIQESLVGLTVAIKERL